MARVAVATATVARIAVVEAPQRIRRRPIGTIQRIQVSGSRWRVVEDEEGLYFDSWVFVRFQLNEAADMIIM